VILAHHGGELGAVSAIAAGAGAVPVLLAVFRAQLRDFVVRWRGRA